MTTATLGTDDSGSAQASADAGSETMGARGGGFRARVPLIIHRAIDRDLADGGNGVGIGARAIAEQTGLTYNTARRALAGRVVSVPTMGTLLAVYGRDGETWADLFDVVLTPPPYDGQTGR